MWPEKLAIAKISVFCRSWLVPRSTMPTFTSCWKDQLSIKLSNFWNQTGQGTPVHRGVGYNSEQCKEGTACPRMIEEHGLGEGQTRKEGGYLLDKPSEENRENGGFKWTGPDSCERPEAGVVRCRAEKKTRRKESLNPKTTHKRSALTGAKIASTNRSRGKVSEPLWHEGRCAVWNGNSRNHQHYAGSFQSVWLRGLTGFAQLPDFLWKYHNIKVDLTATRQSVHTFSMFHSWARLWSDFVYTCIQWGTSKPRCSTDGAQVNHVIRCNDRKRPAESLEELKSALVSGVLLFTIVPGT